MSDLTSVASKDSAKARKNLLHSRLVTLMQLADESAELSYPRRLHMPNLNRQLIFMIGMYGEVASKNLATASGREKTQISRGVKALAEAGLIDRDEARRAIRLSAAGRSIYMDVMKVSRERDHLLRKGLSNDEVAHFLEMTEVLIDRASSIFVADEQTTAIDLNARSSIHHPPAPGTHPVRTSLEEPSYRNMILPWLQSLMTYMRRSGTILFKREAGLSYFEWRVLSLIAENQPLNLSSLIALASRDKSQVVRMIKQLHAAGLVSRRDEGRINAALTLTKAGRACYDKIFAISVERDGFLFDTYRAEERAFYLDALETLTINAGDMLDEELVARSKRAPAPSSSKSKPPKPKGSWTAQDLRDAHADISGLREENARLKQLLAEAILENAILRDHSSRVAPAPEAR